MSNNITNIGGVTCLDIDADTVLTGNIGKFNSVVLMGWDKENEIVFASSLADEGEMLWLAEKFKTFLMKEVVK
jgi:hypothetical protein